MADKWADYLISGVRYAPTETGRTISSVAVHFDNGDNVGALQTWSKSDVVNYIDKGYTFRTIVMSANGSWHMGPKVDLNFVNGSNFIKIEPDCAEEDDLGDLPEF